MSEWSVMSYRRQQVESMLKRAISEVLARGLSDPRIAGMVSVTAVKVSPDLREAWVDVSVLPTRYEKRTLGGLNSAVGRVGALVGRSVNMRTMPRLRFRLDQSLKRQAQVFDAIREGLDEDRRQHRHEVNKPEPDAESPPRRDAAADGGGRSVENHTR